MDELPFAEAPTGVADGRVPTVAVVITTRDEAKHIERCLQSVVAQTYRDFEIVVVDNGSRDETKAIAVRYTHQVFDRGPERSAQRNFGMIEKSRSPYVMYLDADMILGPQCIARCVETIRKSGSVALHVPEVILGTAFFSAVRRFERGFYDGTVIDGARFFMRDAMVRVGGFDESMSGPEDWDIDKKLKALGAIALVDASGAVSGTGWVLGDFVQDRGVDWRRMPGAIFHDEAEFDLWRYLRKKTYYMGSFDAYVAKWGARDRDVRRQLGFWYRFFGVFLENGKWRRLIRHPVFAGGIYFLRGMVGLRYILRRITR